MPSIGDLVVHLNADTRKFKAGMKDGKREMAVFSEAATKLLKIGVAAGIAAIGAAAYKTAQQFGELDKIAKMSDRLGIATEKLAGLNLAFEQSGLSIESGATALRMMTRNIGEALTGVGPGKDALDELGLSAEELSRMSPDLALAEIAEAFKGVERPAERVRIAMDLFGRSGADIISMLDDGKDGLAAFQAEAERLNLTHTREELARVEAANDAMNRLSKVFVGLWQEFAIQTAPAIESIAIAMQDWLLPAITKVADVTERAIALMQEFTGEAGKIDPKLLKQWEDEARKGDLQRRKQRQLDVADIGIEIKRGDGGFAATLEEMEDRLKILRGEATETSLKLQKMLDAGVDPLDVEQLRQIFAEVERLQKEKGDDGKQIRKEQRFTSAQQQGSAEAFETIIRAMQREKSPELAEAKAQTKIQKEIKEAIQAAPVRIEVFGAAT